MQAGRRVLRRDVRGAQGPVPARPHQGADSRGARAHRPDRIRSRSPTCWRALRDAGLDTLPGGGPKCSAERCGERIADRKLAAEEWLDVHRTAHQLGIRSNCTMLYGHVETFEDRVEHLSLLRRLQDETGGFLAYIPLAYHPITTKLGTTLGREGTATSGFDDLRNLAVARFTWDNSRPRETHWIMVTPFLSQAALAFGVDDFGRHGGSREIYPRGGCQRARHCPLDEILRLVPRRPEDPRRTRLVLSGGATFDDAPGQGGAPSPTHPRCHQSRRRVAWARPRPRFASDGSPTSTATQSTGPSIGIVPLAASVVDGVPTALNRMMGAGALDVSVVSAVEYARDAERYLLLPDLAISCEGRSECECVFAKRPADDRAGTGARESELVTKRGVARNALSPCLAVPAEFPLRGMTELSDVARFGDENMTPGS